MKGEGGGPGVAARATAGAPLPGEIRRRLGRPLRVGGIDYLNSRPLLEGLAETLGPDGEVFNCVPSELARRLRAGQLDVALVPVVEYFRGPPEYRIVPGISISSYGPVESIRLYHRVPLPEVERIGLDTSSLTSCLLVKLLFAELWAPGGSPSFESLSPEDGLALLSSQGQGVDAVLLIGDAALRSPGAPGWEVVDLGTEWTRWTGLPFVYALWVYRGPPLPGLPSLFQRCRELGRARVDSIVERGPLPAGMPVSEARRYLHRVIGYDLGPTQIEGLLCFRDRARAAGLLETAGGGELRLLGVEKGRG